MAIDWTILDGIQKIFGGSFMDWLMPKITVLGNGGIVWIIIAVCLILTKKHRKAGFLVLIGMLLGLIIGNGILKNVIARSRPCWINKDWQMLISIPKDYSFPSGHTQASVIAATILTLYKKKWGYTTYSYHSIFKTIFICAFSNRCVRWSIAWFNNRLVYILCRK